MASEPQNRIYIVDDDAAVRDSLEALLMAHGYEVECFASGVDFIDACGEKSAGCVLLDIRMPRMDGMEVQSRLHAIRPDLPVIMITGHGDVSMAVRAMKAGAVDFVEKPMREEILLEGIEAALQIARESHRQQDLGAAAQSNMEKLTPREREVLEQLVIGRANKVIAQALGCSPRTVEIHRARIMEKMNARSLPHLVRLALAAGIEPELN
jgi:two-component system, LuxR family, response regulator FixJ